MEHILSKMLRGLCMQGKGLTRAKKAVSVGKDSSSFFNYFIGSTCYNFWVSLTFH